MKKRLIGALLLTALFTGIVLNNEVATAETDDSVSSFPTQQPSLTENGGDISYFLSNPQTEIGTPSIGARSTSGYIFKNFRQTSYRVTKDWYYVYSSNPSIKGVVQRTCSVFYRKVAYDTKYDLYDRYSGNDIRTVS